MSAALNANGRWLSIIGIGEDGLAGLSDAAKTLIAGAALVVGGQRHLELIAGAVNGETMVWPSPLHDSFPAILEQRGRPVAVIATGDPFFYGIGSVLAREVPPDEIVCLPGISAFSLAAGRLGWALQDCELVTLHGRALERVLPALQPRRRVLALSWDGTTPAKLADLLVRHGFGDTAMTVPTGDAGALAHQLVDTLNDSEQRARLGEGGRRRVLDRFTWRKTAEGSAEHYYLELEAHARRRFDAGERT